MIFNRNYNQQLDAVNRHLSDQKVYVIHSEISGISIAYWSNHLVIFTLKGDLAVEYKDIPDLIKWLKSINRTGYVPLNMPIYFGMKKNKVVIAGKGHIEIWRTRLGELIEEVEGIYQDLGWRKDAKLKGA